MNPNFKEFLLQITQSKDCNKPEIIQSLWSDYGNISRYLLKDGTEDSVVVKHIALNNAKAHPRGWNSDQSHLRKVKSYEVETFWYKNWSQLCHDQCSIPKLIGSFSEGKNQWIVLEDLDKLYPSRLYSVNLDQVKICLAWLAHFHATFLNIEPRGLWPIGSYWHLETRPDEWKLIDHAELKSKAHIIDQILNQSTYKTIIHGDAKLANFCFSSDRKKVAAVDFQYVGGGCGMKDVAYFLGSCLSPNDLEKYDEELLDFYFNTFRNSRDYKQVKINMDELESEWRDLYPVAWTDFTRFMLGWMPTHQKINQYSLKIMHSVLSKI